ncbi:tethering complex subunit VPS16 [Sugiyamaella lignohabitans]|uniref:Probable vacuolar protein sorting-associated protein 16 homolog n=1 Tax=Sugiyamaella lignohabitans TaxID=796027 RepID=A0A167FJ71_9ASCO|nr:tethering complex subunit VPS16 [Sugiyamaella lignohabitans]ANB15369.1 tethering complex subunit VPS16 [Sugiyamaella lignohabitans]
MSSNPALLWEKLDDDFYRNFEGYPMQWKSKDVGNLDWCVAASAPGGGAIALTSNWNIVSSYANKVSSILVYSGSGTLLKKLPWDNGNIRGIGWSQAEELIVVSNNGTARCYYDFEGNFNHFSLGHQAENEEVVDCRFFGSGFVARLGNNQFIAVTNYQDPHVEVFEIPNVAQGDDFSQSTSSNIFQAWQVVPPDNNIGRSLSVVAASSIEPVVYLLDGDSVEVYKLKKEETVRTGGPGKNYGPIKSVDEISHIAVSPDGEQLAYFNNSLKKLVVTTIDFRLQGAEYDHDDDEATPRQLEWCGNTAVGLVWDEDVSLIDSISGHSLYLPFGSTVFVFPEIDGFRTLSVEQHDFFTRVPKTVVDIFRLGSVTPAAILRDCIEQLDRKSSKADENILLIKDSLVEAVDGCVEAASLEFEVIWQKKLLRAAAFGKAAIDLYNSDNYLRVSEHLRVLNNVRQFDVGILISYEQFVSLGPQKLIDRLLARRLHLLAFSCAKHLDLPLEPVYEHWAKTKISVSADTDDKTLLSLITDKLSNIPGIAYESIAKAAFEEGRLDLAVELTDKEPRREKQVPLLLTMQQDELALDEAIKSGNSSLIYYVVMMIHRQLPLANFFRLINDRPVAAACFEHLCRINDKELLMNFYYQDDRRLESVEMKYEQAIRVYNSTTSTSVDIFINEIQESRKSYREIKDRNFEAKALEEQTNLIMYQQQLEKDYDQPFLGFSVTETISSLLKISQVSRAVRFKDEFKVSDKKFTWIRLQALISRHDWDGLHKFATSKKSPIGYEPFYNECLKAGSKRNAALYISYCTNLTYQRRIEMCLEVDDIRRAVNEAVNANDAQALENLKPMATPAIVNEINTAIASLHQR